MNWIPEAIESEGGKSRVALYPRPGLVTYATGIGKGRYASCEINGRAFCVIGAVFYEINANGSVTNRGAVANDGLPASMAPSTTQVLVASGGACYVFTLATNAFAAVSVNAQIIKQVAYLGGFFLALVSNSNQVQISTAGDATSWPGAQVIIVSSFPDNIVGMAVDHFELWLAGSKASQGYYASGSSNIFDPILPGGYIEQGTAATFSIVKFDNTLLWLGQDDKGSGMFWRADGYTPKRVSDHAIEAAIQSYANISDAVAWAQQWHGHTMYKVYFPTANKTWVLDAATNWWHEEGFWANGAFTAHRAQGHVFAFKKHLVLDWNSGNIYQESDAAYDDFGQPIRWVRRAPHIAKEKEWIYINRLEFDVEAGGPQKALTKPSEAQQSLILQSPNGTFWTVTIADNGTISRVGGAVGPAQAVILNDNGAGSTTWQLGITNAGVLNATSVPLFDRTLPVIFAMASTTFLQSGLQISNVGVVTSVLPYTLQRGPLLDLRWSKDGGHDYTNPYSLDCGTPGQYSKRPVMRRLGRALDWVIEISTTDYLRVIDAYTNGSNDQPSERLAHQLRKSA